MFLLVGLGNPGAKYANNRHNAGFHAIDAIAAAQNASPARAKFNGALQEVTLGSEKVLLLRPETFYNDSGNSVRAAVQFYKLTPDDVIVFHDEIDLAPGKLRVKKGGGLAGNNGLRSTAAHLGPDFWRVRIGIGHPGNKAAVTPFVLGDFSKAEREMYYDDLLEGIGRAISKLLPPDEANAGRFVSGVLQPGAKDAKPSGSDGGKGQTNASTATAARPTPRAAEKKGPPPSPFDALQALKKGE